VKGEIYGYKSGRGPKATARECTVVSVNKKKETVALKRVEDDKKFKDVPWAKLVDTEEE